MAQVQMVVKAAEVEEGDFLVGLGNGYVFTEPEVGPDWRDPFAPIGNEEDVLIMFHDNDGEENYLLVNPDLMVTVKRDEE